MCEYNVIRWRLILNKWVSLLVKVSTLQGVRKVKHAIDFNVKPDNFQFSQELALRLNQIENYSDSSEDSAGGIVFYTQLGYPLLSIKLIEEFKEALKSFCDEHSKPYKRESIDVCIVFGRPAIVFYDEVTKRFVAFNKNTKKFITAFRLNPTQAERFEQKGLIGF